MYFDVFLSQEFLFLFFGHTLVFVYRSTAHILSYVLIIYIALAVGELVRGINVKKLTEPLVSLECVN